MKPARTLATLAAAAALLAWPAAAQAGSFGIEPGSLTTTALASEGGVLDSQASSHPYSWTLAFKLNTDKEGHSEGGEMRDVLIDLPAGLVGDPFAVPRCTRQEFEGFGPNCSPNTQVGILKANVPGLGFVTGPIYDMVPLPGTAAQLGFSATGLNALQNVSVLTEAGYGLHVATNGLPLEVTSVEATVWGTPADESHDDERGLVPAEGGVPYVGPHLPFLTMPAQCSVPLATRVAVDSKLAPGVYDTATAYSLDTGGNPAAQDGCASVPFKPQIASQLTSKLTGSPAGLDFELKLPNEGLKNPGGVAETEPRKAVVTLPEGVTVNPSFAEGTGVCTKAQYEEEQLETKAGQGCPQAAKLGSLVVHSPLLEEAVEGALYVAAPYENPFGTLTALYMVARAPERGILVKQAGRVAFDHETGQITSTFEGLPPLPFSDFKLHFREGPRAPLVSPPACGEYQTTAKFTPFSATSDAEAVEKTASFQIEAGADGGACPTGGLPPFKPGLIAGTLNNAAGSFSPFYLRLQRTDAEQEITHFSIKLPPGLTGKLAGIPYCPEAGIAQAKSREGAMLGGSAELEDPSCPAASQIGRTLVGAGVGTVLVYVPGKVYLAGPYNGSNLSIVAITAAKAGPFDLGTVVVREALRINPETAEVFIDATGSDPIPHIIEGVPVHLRDIRAYVDRPEFTLNPTDCEPTSVASTVLGSGLDFASEADDNPVTVASRFQAADCAALPFKPRLSLRLIGSTKRGGFPKFVSHLQMNGIGEAGIARAQILLPHSEFIANAHFNNICTRVQFAEGAGNGANCPAGSIYGYAKASTPLLSEPLEGPVMLRSNPERKLPDVVAALHNSQVAFDLVGNVDSVKGQLRTTFANSPDAPVTSFDLVMAGGKKGLFENSADLCERKHRATLAFGGQNGKYYRSRPVLRVTCKHKGRKHRRHHKRGRRAKRRSIR
ncbi:MAG: hypothetical protein ACM3N0_09350 [Chloroflexota bacterium]